MLKLHPQGGQLARRAGSTAPSQSRPRVGTSLCRQDRGDLLVEQPDLLPEPTPSQVASAAEKHDTLGLGSARQRHEVSGRESGKHPSHHRHPIQDPRQAPGHERLQPEQARRLYAEGVLLQTSTCTGGTNTALAFSERGSPIASHAANETGSRSPARRCEALPTQGQPQASAGGLPEARPMMSRAPRKPQASFGMLLSGRERLPVSRHERLTEDCP